MARVRHRCLVDLPEDDIHQRVVQQAQPEQRRGESPLDAEGQETHGRQQGHMAHLAEHDHVEQTEQEAVAAAQLAPLIGSEAGGLQRLVASERPAMIQL